ncbi:cytochrome P450 CYP72A616-like [Aristolochia californica]|uniref:cytochrome P450 CYP72A616-like n=1 Tax=Aristolochia californica TaxID=171875 RepID=UPI0035DFB9FD
MGPPYKFLSGNLKESVRLLKEARSKPMELSHRIAPHVVPFAHQVVKEYGKMSVTWFGRYPRVTIMEPEVVREVLSNKFGHFQKPRRNPLVKQLVPGLAEYEGEKWAKHRRIISPAFHVEKLKRMLPSFAASCTDLMERWENVVAEGPAELDVWPEMEKLTGDVISRTAFGSNYKEGNRIFRLQTEVSEHIVESIQSVQLPGFRYLPTKRNLRIREIDREVRALLTNLIKKREEKIRMGEATDDLLGLLMESNVRDSLARGGTRGLTVEEVIQECKLFYFAGQETTSVLLTWTMIVLSMHPSWQQRAREEVLQTFGKNKPDFDGLSHLKIVTMILYEVLRLYPPIINVIRTPTKRIQIGRNWFIPGVHLTIPILLIHHDPELWGEDVEEFKPERFAEGISKASRNQSAFFPFGWGPRICVGQNFALTEAKLGLSMILQRFSFELSPAYAHAPGTFITLQPLHGAQIILQRV